MKQNTNDINVNLSEILKELKSLTHNATEEVLLIIITAIILVIILIQRIYHCYALVCKNNDTPLHNDNTNDNTTSLIPRRC